ncbi:MAG: STAS domain-containing protein [Tannerellaceae bacterium]|nr:STAS domain-containing protein [Tannerellaceae bacterium]
MEIKIIKGENTTIAVSGQLDTLTAVEFESTVREVLDNGAVSVILDAADLTYVSSAGLRIILTLQKGMTAKNGTLVIQNVQPDIKEIFDITGFSTILTIE